MARIMQWNCFGKLCVFSLRVLYAPRLPDLYLW